MLAPTSAHNAPPKAVAGRAIEDIYRKMTPLEHVLARPDTYIGSVEKQEKAMWVHSGEAMVERKIEYAPGLYKIFDEVRCRADLCVSAAAPHSIALDAVWQNGAALAGAG